MRANLKAFQMQAAQQLFAAAAASLSTAQLGACMWEAAQAPPLPLTASQRVPVRLIIIQRDNGGAPAVWWQHTARRVAT